MVLPGHLAGGFLATTLLLELTSAVFTPFQTMALLIIGTLAGDLPDIDQIMFYFEHKSDKANKTKVHRQYLTHAPIFWIIICLLIVLTGYLISNTFVSYIGWVILLGTLTHFIFDSIEYGVMWLWPISPQFYYLRKGPDVNINKREGTLGAHWQFVSGYYVKGLTMYVEIAVTLAALWVAFH